MVLSHCLIVSKMDRSLCLNLSCFWHSIRFAPSLRQIVCHTRRKQTSPWRSSGELMGPCAVNSELAGGQDSVLIKACLSTPLLSN